MQRTCTASCNARVRPHARRWTASCILRGRPHAFFVYGIMHFYVASLMQALFIVQAHIHIKVLFYYARYGVYFYGKPMWHFFNIRKLLIYFLIFKKKN